MLPHFYYHPRMLEYVITPDHPLNPERLRRTVELLSRFGVEVIDPQTPSLPSRGAVEEVSDLLRVHDDRYVDAVRRLDPAEMDQPGLTCDELLEYKAEFGFMSSDNPVFPHMYSSSIAYVAGSVRAAEAVRDGAPLAFNMSGGLHHALRAKASGFCVFNDPAIACHILRERINRVAYVDIDVHHGDGVQAIFYDDPSVLTSSIHEEGRSLWPGTGWTSETGASFSSLNVPIQAHTTGDVWLSAFQRGVMPALTRFAPGAIVLQMGTDSHFLDPLAHIRNSAQEWLEAVRLIRDFGVPIVALGGGGYEPTCVPRMWAAACLTLGGLEVPELLPTDLVEEWGIPRFFDTELPGPVGSGREYADGVINWLEDNHGLLKG